MPIYEYQCSDLDCNHKQELIIITSDDEEDGEEIVFCENCGSEAKKTMSVPSKGIVK
jgi:putative FmdB family regulatory protein